MDKMKEIIKLKENRAVVLAFLLVLIGLSFLVKTRFFKEEESLSKKEATDITPSSETQEASLEKADKVLTFAVIADIHLGEAPYLPKLLKEALKKTKDYQVEFVVLLGDLTQQGALKEFQSLKKILDDSGLVYYLVPGNHDIGEGTEEKAFENFQSLFGPTYREVVYKLTKNDGSKNKIKRARLFFLDTSRIGMDVETIMDKEQWLWLKEKLGHNEKDASELRLVFSQTPLEKFGLESHYLREFFCNSFIDGLFEADIHSTQHFSRDCPIAGWKHEEDFFYSFPSFKPGALFNPRHEFPGFLIMDYFDNCFFNFKRVLVGN